MVDYVPFTTPNMPHDFELYSNQEQQLDFLPTSQPYLPSTSYPMDPTFNGHFDPLASLSEAPRSQELQSYYDGIAQGVKASFQQYASPMASPHSTSNSFQEQPPVLSASSESGASVSSSAIGSPSQFNEPWNPLSAGLGLPQGFEYSGMVEPVKVPGYVGESTNVFFAVGLVLLSIAHNAHTSRFPARRHVSSRSLKQFVGASGINPPAPNSRPPSRAVTDCD